MHAFLRFVAFFIVMEITADALQAAKPETKKSTSSPGDNPLFSESTLPYNYPPFDKIKDTHFVPAFDAGMKEQLKEVEKLAAIPEPPTFENTIVALERTGQLLERAERIFTSLNSAHTNPAMQKIQTEMAPKLSAHSDAIFLKDRKSVV